MATKITRMLVWQGISQLDGVTPIIVLATGINARTSSANAKTGAMIQTWILRADVAPVDVIREGLDVPICGTCPHRSRHSGGSGACYVNVGQGPRSTWAAHQRGGSLPFDLAAFAGRKVRIGSYGDPAAVPFEVWEQIAESAAAVTGYTHQWRTADARFSRYLMASADSAAEGHAARKIGYRSFIVRAIGTDKPRGAVQCPASAEAGKRTVCADCLQCGGTSNGRKADISIIAHGATAKSFRSLPLSVI